MSATSKEGRRRCARRTPGQLAKDRYCSCGEPGVRQFTYIARLWRCNDCLPQIIIFLWSDLNRLT